MSNSTPTPINAAWPTSAETEAVAWPIDTMDGAEWNILDATGARIAICGFDVDSKTDEFRKTSSRIAWAIVGMLRNLKCKNEVLEEEVGRLTAELDAARKVIERLPKTADGVPITHGMMLYRHGNGSKSYGVMVLRDAMMASDHLPVWDTYSSTLALATKGAVSHD